MKITLAKNIWDLQAFYNWLEQHDHEVSLGSSTTSYIDGQACINGTEANSKLSFLHNQFSRQIWISREKKFKTKEAKRNARLARNGHVDGI